MSTTQSHVQTGPQSTFNFNPSQRLTQMNARPEVIRQPGVPQLPQMGINFMQNRQQPEQHGQPPMGMLSNNPPAMNILGGGPSSNNNPVQLTPQQRYQQQIQQADQQRQQQRLLQQARNAQSANAPGGSTSGPPMGGLGPDQMGFPGNMLQQQPGNNPQVRRVQSHPQPLNQSATHLQMSGGAMHLGSQGGGAIAMGMNAQTSMPAQLRQAAQQHQMNNLRMQQMSGQGHISPEMAMAMRQPGNPGIPQNGQRSISAQAQVMNGQQPGLVQSHPTGMQPNNFSNPMSHPHQPSQTTSPSPRLGSRSQPQTPANMNMPNPGQPPPNANRPQGDMFNFQNPQFPQVLPNNAGRTNNSQFPFVPSSASPPNHHSDMPQSMGALGANNRPGGFLTPAQQLQSGDNYNGFNMPPPQSNVPPRPPSNNNSHPPLPHHQQQSPHHLSPQQQDHLAGHPPQRPQSQPQNPSGRPPSQSGPSNTPRTSHAQLPSHAAHLTGGRIVPLSQQGGPQTLHQPQSASGHPLPIAPRPPPQVVSAAVGPSSATSTVFPPSEGGPSQGQPGGPQRSSNMSVYSICAAKIILSV